MAFGQGTVKEIPPCEITLLVAVNYAVHYFYSQLVSYQAVLNLAHLSLVKATSIIPHTDIEVAISCSSFCFMCQKCTQIKRRRMYEWSFNCSKRYVKECTPRLTYTSSRKLIQ